MKYLIMGLTCTFLISSCIEKETDFDFQLVNSLKNSIKIEFYFDPKNESETINDGDTLYSKVTYSNNIRPALNSKEFNQEFKILSIKVNDSFSVSKANIDSLNLLTSWQYTHVEDIRYYQHHLYILTLTAERLGL